MNHDRFTSQLLIMCLAGAALGSAATLLFSGTLSDVPGGILMMALVTIGTAVFLGQRGMTIARAYGKALRDREHSEANVRALSAKLEKQETGNPAGRTADGDPPSREKIPVLLVDDHVMVRQGLRSLIEAYPNLEVIGEASNGHEALKLVEKRRPAVVLMDINMPQLNGIEATARIKSEHPEVSVIGLSMNVGTANREAMNRAGASMLLAKEAVVTELYSAILAVTVRRMRKHARPFSEHTDLSSEAV